MHIDLVHAAISALLVFATITILQATGIARTGERLNWKAVAAIFVVIFIFNLFWPG